MLVTHLQNRIGFSLGLSNEILNFEFEKICHSVDFAPYTAHCLEVKHLDGHLAVGEARSHASFDDQIISPTPNPFGHSAREIFTKKLSFL